MKPCLPEPITLTYLEGPRSLQFKPGSLVYWVDGIQRTFRSVYSSDMLDLVAKNNLDTVAIETFYEFFLKTYSIGSRHSMEAGIHKIVHGLRQDLAVAGLKMEVLKNVRGLGYRLAEGWRVEQPQSSEGMVRAELLELRKLIHRCVTYVNERPIQATSAGLYYLDSETHVVQENFLILDRVGWQLLHSLGDPKLVPEIIDIKRDLSQLMSYVVFWRVGHRITPDLWREDFEHETAKILGDLEMRLGKIQAYLKKGQPPIAIRGPRVELVSPMPVTAYP